MAKYFTCFCVWPLPSIPCAIPFLVNISNRVRCSSLVAKGVVGGAAIGGGEKWNSLVGLPCGDDNDD